jgi:hypothetical protein
VPDRSHVHVRLRSLKLLLRHLENTPVSAWIPAPRRSNHVSA